MPESEILKLKRQVTITREVPMLRTVLSPLEACKVISDYVRETEMVRFGFGDELSSEITVEPLWGPLAKDFNGFKVEILLAAKE